MERPIEHFKSAEQLCQACGEKWQDNTGATDPLMTECPYCGSDQVKTMGIKCYSYDPNATEQH